MCELGGGARDEKKRRRWHVRARVGGKGSECKEEGGQQQNGREEQKNGKCC